MPLGAGLARRAELDPVLAVLAGLVGAHVEDLVDQPVLSVPWSGPLSTVDFRLIACGLTPIAASPLIRPSSGVRPVIR